MLFEVTPADIGCLSDSELRELIGRLVEQEVRRAGHSVAAVTYGGHQNAADGGIDVRVDLPGTADIGGFVPRPATGYQVKAETMPPSKIRPEMRPNNTLRPSIEALDESGGAYVIVSSRDSVSDTAFGDRLRTMRQAVGRPPAENKLHVDFYDGKRLASWVNQHPGLIPWVRIYAGNPLSGWRPFEDWSSSPSAVDEEYLLDEQVRLTGIEFGDDGLNTLEGIDRLREILSKPAGNVRLLGLSGVGKTRLVQALFDERIGHHHLAPELAVYTDIADEPNPLPADLLQRLLHLDARCVLIIDNCGAELHRRLSRTLKTASGQVSLVTIEYDITEDEPEDTRVFRLEPASAAVVENILGRRFPNLSGQDVRTIAAFSEGNARVALAVANTARQGDSLANLRDRELFERLFRQKNEDDPALLKAAQVCALVYSFEGKTLDGERAELSVLAALAGQSPAELYRHIAELRRRQLVQTRSQWRAMLPHALAHKLAKQALEEIPLQSLKRALMSRETPPRLMKSFTRRLGCLHDSPQAQALVAEWFGSGGWLSRIEDLSTFQTDLFANLAPIDPRITLNAVQYAYERSNGFSESNSRRIRLVVRILQSLAYAPQLFEESIALIAGMARGRGGSNQSDDPLNVFKSLFPIRASGTHATIQQRITFLRSLARSADGDDQELAVLGLDRLLQCNNFHVRHGYDFGARRRDSGHTPRSEEEVRAWFNPAFDLCRELMDYGGIFPGRIRKIFAERFPAIVCATTMLDAAVDLADDMAQSHGWPEGWTAARKTIQWAEKNNRTDMAGTLQALSDRLAPQTLAERIAVYVVPPRWSALDVAKIKMDNVNQIEAATQRVESVCSQIGQELSEDVDRLQKHLPDLLRTPSQRIAVVSDAIARHSAQPVLVWRAITKENLTQSFPHSIKQLLAGFLGGLSHAAPRLAAECLDTALLADSLHPYFVSMQISAGIDEAGHRRLLNALEKDSVPTQDFQALSWGRVCDGLTGPQLKELLFAIKVRDGGLGIAVDILQMRMHSYRGDGIVLDEATIEAARLLLDEVTFDGVGASEAFPIASIIRHGLAAPDDEALVSRVAFRLGQASVNHATFLRDHDELLSVLAERFSRALLDGFVEATQWEGRGMIALSWYFQDDESRPSPFSKIDVDAIWSWVSVDPPRRSVEAAELIPPFQVEEGGNALTWTPTALHLMREAPNPPQVLAAFREWLFPRQWSGSLAATLERRLPLLTQLTQDSDVRVAEWSRETIADLESEMARAREREVDWARVRDDRFEY